VSRDLIQVVPIGVYVAPEPHRILAQLEFSVAVVLAGRGAPYAAIECVIDGLSMVAPDFRQVTVFADIDEAVKARAWKRAGDRNVREQFSLIPDVLEHRELVLSASVLVVPAPTGRNNSFMLQAMAAPMATLATRDPHVDVLTTDEAAIIVEHVEPAAWATALRRLLSDPQAARGRAESARRIIAQRHSMTAQSELLTATYERMLTGGNVTLPA
jgi:glycosyltransferase involved in cell wall biosynthesis